MTTPPLAEKRPHPLEMHGRQRVDEWYWLRDDTDPKVPELLTAENAYVESAMAHTDELQEQIFSEIRSHVQETDLSLPTRRGAWWYYSRTQEGLQYPIHCRKPDHDGQIGSDDEENVLLDENALGTDSDYFALGTFDVSPDGNWLAYSVDLTGDEQFTLRIRDLRTGADLPDHIENAFFGSAWSRNADVLFYVRTDGPMRPYQVWRHRVGEDQSRDVLVYHEHDDRFFVGVGNSKSDDLVVISCESKTSSEQRVLRSDTPYEDFHVIAERTDGLEYAISHHRDRDGGERYFIVTNLDAPNFRVMTTPIDATSIEHWTQVIAHHNDVRIEAIEPFADFLVVMERRNANAGFSIFDIATAALRQLPQSEEPHTIVVNGNPEFTSSVIRYSYTSMTTPMCVYEHDVQTGETVLRKQQPVPGDFSPKNYTSSRVWATSADGTRVPMTIVARTDRGHHTTAKPALLWGYGAYEISTDPYFSPLRLSLLDRGFLIAFAHIRGGGELGRLWYYDGRREKKHHTFEDFVACAEYLVEHQLTTPSELAIRGGSAGGFLIGAALNMRPELFGAAVANVPFVDVLTTMCDPSLPLTTHEYDEWGDPNNVESFDAIAAYSPVDNVRSAAYPPILVTTGMNDPLVSYVEPAKWVQVLRDRKTDSNPIYLRVDMDAGHQGLSGRYDAWKQEAFVYAYLIDTLGVANTES